MPRDPFDSVRGGFHAAEVMLWASLVDTCFDGECTNAGPLGTHWVTDELVYSIDYERGIDILRYTGKL